MLKLVLTTIFPPIRHAQHILRADHQRGVPERPQVVVVGATAGYLGRGDHPPQGVHRPLHRRVRSRARGRGPRQHRRGRHRVLRSRLLTSAISGRPRSVKPHSGPDPGPHTRGSHQLRLRFRVLRFYSGNIT